MSNLAIIPARGGSKGIPRKNVKKIADKPLISWSIEHALRSSQIDRVIVSTDDAEIAAAAVEAGAEVPFVRPAEFANDTATTESVIRQCLDWLQENESYAPELVVLLQPTSPMRRPGRIDEAVNFLREGNFDSILSVVSFESFLWSKFPQVTAHYNYAQRPRRQDLEPSDIRFKENGSIYVTKRLLFDSHNNRLGGNIGLFQMDESEGYEIDTPVDWWMLDAILRNFSNE